MNRHDRRRLDAIHKKFTDGLVSTQPMGSEHEIKVKTEFFKWLADLKKQGQRPMVAHGALGEFIGRDAYVKSIVRPEAGGVEQEFWGISYRLKLPVQGLKLHNLDMAKSAIFAFPKELMKFPLIALGTLISLLISRKKFIRTLDDMFYQVLNRSVRWNAIEENEYNPAAKEIKRACIAVLEREFGFSFADAKVFFQDFKFPYPDGTITHLLAEISLFLALFLELDTAYRFRIQDAFAPLEEKGIDRFWKGLETLIERETKDGIAPKWKWIKLALKVSFALFPDVRKFVKGVMDEVVWATVKMDEADWYFALGYISYDFGGIPREERFALRERANKDRDHVMLYA